MTSAADREELSIAERFATLNHLGVALMREPDETNLLHLIAEGARALTGAEFAAFFLRTYQGNVETSLPIDGKFFHLADIVGITPAQEAVFRHMSLGGHGLLAPIFHEGRSLCLPDIAVYPPSAAMTPHEERTNQLMTSDIIIRRLKVYML